MSEFERFKNYTPAQLHCNKQWYISFYAYDPAVDKLRRKRIKLNHIKSKKERKRYANELIKRINYKLATGWNPWIDQSTNKEYTRLYTAKERYLKQIYRQVKDGIIKQETYDDYKSYLEIFFTYLEQTGKKDMFAYELDKNCIVSFLDYIYYEKKRTAQTRNNYLNYLRVFSGWLIEKDYLKVRPTEGVKSMNIPAGSKQRVIIPKNDLKRIFDYLEKHDKFFLFAVKFIYYTFARPNEMAQLQIRHINFRQGTLSIPAHISKNKKYDIVTIPDTLGKLMIDLEVHKHPQDYYIFSHYFRPGAEVISGKKFRDTWSKYRKKLNLPDNYKFYSLKDTGITDMLKATNDTIAVRNQARHHSISITNTYTDFTENGGNDTIRNVEY